MKKIKTILFILISILFFDCTVFASTKTNVRTESNYLVPSDVIVTESVRNNILNTPAVNASEKIYDFAEVLSADEEKQLYKKIDKFVKQSNMDLVIITIKNNNKSDSGQYAHDFYNYNDFGNDGVLLLIDLDRKGVYMVKEGAAYDLFPNERMKPILKNVYKNVVESNYYNACNGFITSVSDFIYIGLDDDVFIDDEGNVVKNKLTNILIAGSVACVITLIIIMFMINASKNKRIIVTPKNYLNEQSARITTISEMNLGTKIGRAPLNKK